MLKMNRKFHRSEVSQEPEAQSFDIKRPRLICSERAATSKEVIERIFGKQLEPFPLEVRSEIPLGRPLYKDKPTSIWLSIPGATGTYPVTMRAVSSDYPPKYIKSSTNGDQFIKYKPVSIGNTPTEVTFRLSDVTSRYLNQWIFLVFYVEDNSSIKPLIEEEVIIRAKQWVPTRVRRRNTYYQYPRQRYTEEMRGY